MDPLIVAAVSTVVFVIALGVDHAAGRPTTLAAVLYTVCTGALGYLTVRSEVDLALLVVAMLCSAGLLGRWVLHQWQTRG